MATPKKARSSKPARGKGIDEAEALINFRYGLAIMQQNGDKAGLAKAKKEHPAEFADWEKRQAGVKKAAANKSGKTGKK